MTTDQVCANDIDRSLNPYPILKFSTVESMEDYLTYKECQREFEDVKEVPPLALIYLESFMERAWTWKRLVPWTVGRVPLADYMEYLKKYFRKNGFRADVRAEARRCLKMEMKYIRRRGEPVSKKNGRISSKITKLAEEMCVSGSLSITAAAALKCIAEEARFMCRLKTGSKMFKFSDEVRQTASKLMTFEGPESQSVAAGMLGMAEEARIACKLKTIADPESFETFEVCRVVRECTLNFLIHIQRDGVHESPATSSTDKTEGYAISENSADEEFAENKNSMDIHQKKDNKRKRNAGDQSEAMVVSSLPGQ